MKWKVSFHPHFLREFEQFPEELQDNLMAKALMLEEYGPLLSRPHADSLKGSRYANMKELRLEVRNGPWRVAFAFDPTRKAILLVAGNKTGKNQKQFYKSLIHTADIRYSSHLIKRKK